MAHHHFDAPVAGASGVIAVGGGQSEVGYPMRLQAHLRYAITLCERPSHSHWAVSQLYTMVKPAPCNAA